MKRDFANAYKSYRDFANICRICAEGIRPSLTPSCNQLLLVGPYLRAQLICLARILGNAQLSEKKILLTEPLQGERTCIGGSEYVLFEILD